MESAGGSDNQDGRGDRTPPDEQQMRIGRSRVARGFDPTDDARRLDLAGSSSGLIGATFPQDGSLGSGNRSSGSTGAPDDAIDPGPRFRAWSEPVPPGTGPLRCQFLRSIGPDGRLADAQKTAVPSHRCAAFGDPLPLSMRQQELVCLQRVHVSCPRYLRGTLLANEGQARTDSQQERRSIPVLTVIGVVLVILAAAVLLGAFLGLPPLGGGGSASQLPVAAASASRSATAVPKSTSSPTARSSASAVVTARVTAAPTPTLTPTPAPTPVASSTWPPGATASRMDLVVPCAGEADCYVYTVRGPGAAPSGNGSKVADTLAGVVAFFGVDLATVRQMNPWLGGGSTVHPGDQLKIPSPTR